jgi:hypothetical protein
VKTRRVVRSPIKKKKSAELLSLEVPNGWEIRTEGNPIEAPYLMNIQDGELILKELNIFLRPQKSKREVANRILRYLRYVANLHGAVSAQSLKGFKDFLDKSPQSEVNTKSQLFSACKGFVKHLISVSVVQNETLPKNFKNADRKPIPSFSEIAQRQTSTFEVLMNEYSESIRFIESEYKLDQAEAITLFFNEAVMDFIHEKSLKEVSAALDDIEWIESIIKGTSDSEKEFLKGVDDFSKAYGDFRNEKDCFAILYFNDASNKSVDNWVKGTYDFLKTRGWKSIDIREELQNSASLFVEYSKSLPDAKKNAFKSIQSYAWKDLNPKSIELALKILYSQFGFCIPNSEKWPKGVVDYLKCQGWTVSRVQSAFIPGRYIQRPLLMALLSHRALAPNVDTAFFYTLTTSLTKSIEHGLTNVFMGKERGAGVDVDVKDSDPLVVLLKDYIYRFNQTKAKLSFAKNFFDAEHVSIFGHINREKTKNGVYEFSTYDDGTPSDWVRIKLKQYSEELNLIKLLIGGKGTATGQNFRPTHVVIDVLKGASVGQVKRKLNHANFSTTKDYVARTETAELLSKKAFDFQNFLVSQALNNVDLQALEQEEENFEEFIGERAKRHIEKLKDKSAVRTLLAEPNIVAEWIAYREKILTDKDRLIISNPARWSNHWLIILAEYEALLSMTSTRIFHEAQKIAANIKLPYLD